MNAETDPYEGYVATDTIPHPRTARFLASTYLAVSLPQRWAHTLGVARKATELAGSLPLSATEQSLLVSSAFLHDIGYSPEVNKMYRWHPLDGAALLRYHMMGAVANEVAWHTTAWEEAALITPDGLYRDLLSTLYYRRTTLVSDALTYADMTTGPTGERCTFQQRLIEIRARHGAESRAVKAMEGAWERLDNARQRVNEARLLALVPDTHGIQGGM